jgi:hypothetical protein
MMRAHFCGNLISLLLDESDVFLLCDLILFPSEFGFDLFHGVVRELMKLLVNLLLDVAVVVFSLHFLVLLFVFTTLFLHLYNTKIN